MLHLLLVINKLQTQYELQVLTRFSFTCYKYMEENELKS